MKFITIKQLKEERKELDVDNLTTQVMEIELKAKLEQTKEIVELIKEELKHREYIEDTSVIPILKALISKLEGKENDNKTN